MLTATVGAVIVLAVVAILAAFANSPSVDRNYENAALAEPVVPQAATESEAPQGQTAMSQRPPSGVAPAWVAGISEQTGISAVAVEAYGAATLRLTREQASCKLGWTTLAGIGAIESRHGMENGSQLLADGTTSLHILGPALNGKDGVLAIPSDAESQKWHGDAAWDHAFGPMQFIPSTWDKWQSDGNGDGVADPHNIFDAAYAAGRYLCASSGDMTTGEGWSRAIFSYNHSDEYVRNVLATANSYAN